VIYRHIPEFFPKLVNQKYNVHLMVHYPFGTLQLCKLPVLSSRSILQAPPVFSLSLPEISSILLFHQLFTFWPYTPLAVVSCARKTTRINHCYDSANSGSFVERGRCAQHTKIPSLYALSNRQAIKKRLMFLPGYGLIAIADWSIIVQCHLLVKHGF
jgi:hypothetical protein